jgi:hypothetical protein
VVLGLAGLGSGGVAVFITQLEAGPVALLAIGLVLLLIGTGGRLPTRLKVGENEAAWDAVEGFVSRVADEVPSDLAPQLVDALNELAQAAPSAAAAGLGVVTERITYERMVRKMLSEAVRELNRFEGAERLGGLEPLAPCALLSGRKEPARHHLATTSSRPAGAATGQSSQLSAPLSHANARTHERRKRQ